MKFENDPNSQWFIPETVVHRNGVVRDLASIYGEGIGAEDGQNIVLYGDVREGKTSVTRHALIHGIAKEFPFKAIYGNKQSGFFQELTGFGSSNDSYQLGRLQEGFSFDSLDFSIKQNRTDWPSYQQIAIIDGLTVYDNKFINKIFDITAKDCLTTIYIMNTSSYNSLAEKNLLPSHRFVHLKKLSTRCLFDIATHRANEIHNWYPPVEVINYIVDLVGILDNMRAGSCASAVSKLYSIINYNKCSNITPEAIRNPLVKILDIDFDIISSFEETLNVLETNVRRTLQMITEYMCKKRKIQISKKTLFAAATLWGEKYGISKRSLSLTDSINTLLTLGILNWSDLSSTFYVWVDPAAIYQKISDNI